AHRHLRAVSGLEGRPRHGGPNLPAIRPGRLKTAKLLVEKAVKLRKVFSVQGPYPVIRAALLARGWVERRLPHRAHRVPHCHGDGDENDIVEKGEKVEALDDMYDVMSRLARNEMTYFYWTTRRNDVDCRSLRHHQVTNHYANAGTFTTKVGLCVNLRSLQWFDAADPDTFFPRCYRLGAGDEKQAFVEDFRRTACTSLLQHVVETGRRRRADDGGQHIKNSAVRDLEHCDIDVTIETSPTAEEQRWAEFLQDYYKVVHEGALIRGSSMFVERCQAMLIRLREVCPQLDTDGLNNIWIIKPGAKSRGRGITCMDRLDEIVALVDSDRTLTKESKWVVQKYLERPLLIHGTKFDLRQWFLVTDWNPLTVWFYGECYLRFSTQPYSIKTLDSSVHLCNNSIQKHFQPARDRHPGVPEDNMWSCSQFQAFLQQQGRGAEWESVVVPGMQQAVIHALQTAQDLVEPRKASFELYGADFILGRDLRPWLLEINASPTMAISTAVTARLCPAVQLDTLRVVLDRRSDPSAHTGGFHLIYKQAAVEVPQYMGVNLLVEGAPVRRTRPPHRRTVSSNPLSVQHKSSGQEASKLSSFCHSGMENREKKRQLTSLSPKRECEGRKEAQNIHRSSWGLVSKQPLAPQAEPRRKVQCLGLGASGATLVPWSLSSSLSPPHSVVRFKCQPSQGHGSYISRSFFPQTAFESQNKNSNQVFPSLSGPLPTLDIFSLPRNIVAGAAAFHSPNLFSRSNIDRRRSFLCSQKQSMVKYKGESRETQKPYWFQK
uniref:Tubulin tyrosine ligase-like family, member 3 n=1 Tax=Mola mola TaxID=94237 RepID=A0A3Q3XSJ4_MOLML